MSGREGKEEGLPLPAFSGQGPIQLPSVRRRRKARKENENGENGMPCKNSLSNNLFLL